MTMTNVSNIHNSITFIPGSFSISGRQYTGTGTGTDDPPPAAPVDPPLEEPSSEPGAGDVVPGRPLLPC